MTKIYRSGQFVWRELMTTDTAASVRFYTEAFGWKTDVMTMPNGMEYTVVKAGETGVGGIMKLPMPGVPAYWGSSVSVEDVDAVAQKVPAAGGQVIVPPMDAGGMGRYAGFQDPQGAVINVWHGNDGDMPAPERPGVGTFCWEQLNTTAPDAALEFYAQVFGWTNKPFSGGGDMKVFDAGPVGVASVMTAPPGVPAHWLTYVVVDQLAAAYSRIRQQGGKVLVERIDVPTVGAIGVVQDNVGALIGVFEAPSA